MKNLLKKIWFQLILFFVFAFIPVVILNCCTSHNGNFNVLNHVPPEKMCSSEIVRFPDGQNIPEGYEVIEVSTFENNILSMNCGYEFMIKQAERATLTAGGCAYRIFNVKKPDNVTTFCWNCNILILKISVMNEKGGD